MSATQGGDDQAISKEERRQQAMEATAYGARSGRDLRDEDIEVINLTLRLEQSARLKSRATAIWFDSDPSDHFSDRDPTDPWHGGVGPPIDPVDVVFPPTV